MNTNSDCSFSDEELFRENYAWVDNLLEEKYYAYISEDEDNITVNYETFSQMDNQDQDQDQDDSYFNILIRDLKKIISYHEDRRQRRNKQIDEFFELFNKLNADI